MNLSAYDIMLDVNYRKTWIDPQFKKLYSYEFPKHKYYSFLKRYNKDYKCNELYIVLYDEEQELISNYSTEEKYNICKFRLNNVWEYFNKITSKQNITVTLEETQKDCVIYKFDI